MHKPLLISSGFIVACIVVIVAFITATTYSQLGVAIILYPLVAFFAYRVFQNKIWRHPAEEPVVQTQPLVKENIGIADIDKRLFLKLIGGAGLIFLLFSLFNKKGEGLFSKYLPGSFTTKTADSSQVNSPTQNQLLDEYKISEIDSNVISFYGFIKKGGNWYIMRADTDKGSFRYARGESNFSDNWNKRQNLKYDYFDDVF